MAARAVRSSDAPPVARAALMLQHATLEIRRDQLDACVAFYALMGFQRVDPPSSLADRAAWVQRHATQIHLMWVEDPVSLPRGHVAVVVDDYEATLKALGEAGHQPEPRREHWGSPRALVRDPAGNLVEVMAFPPS
jgi:catechol 2,3-dioxygenase-like lactoylglutathione lyase family enzyme